MISSLAGYKKADKELAMSLLFECGWCGHRHDLRYLEETFSDSFLGNEIWCPRCIRTAKWKDGDLVTVIPDGIAIRDVPTETTLWVAVGPGSYDIFAYKVEGELAEWVWGMDDYSGKFDDRFFCGDEALCPPSDPGLYVWKGHLAVYDEGARRMAEWDTMEELQAAGGWYLTALDSGRWYDGTSP